MNISKIDNYEDAVSYIMSIPRFADKDEYRKMREFYALLNNERKLDETLPREAQGGAHTLRQFHVAGTNGKGSVCAYLTSIHMAMGRHVGTFTSPHLVDVRERITVDGRMIGKDEFLAAFRRVAAALGKKPEYSPSYFAWFFFVALEAFMTAGVDAIIWETGLGGRLDATNVIDDKDVCIITSIGLDHMEYLGDTPELIAREKAGILRSRIPAVIFDKTEESTEAIKDVAKGLNTPLTLVGKTSVKMGVYGHKGIDFSYDSRYYNNVMFKIGSLGAYQVWNASLAIAAMEIVYEQNELSLEALRAGLENMKWPGRMEEIEPGVIFDGAHNVDGIEAFIDSVGMDGCLGKRHLLFSAVGDKQADIMLDMIVRSGHFFQIGVAHIDNTRGIDTETLKKMCEGIESASVYGSVREAYEDLKTLREEGDRLYVCGSLYLVGELKALID